MSTHSREPISDMRFMRMSDRMNALLSELYHSGADPLDLDHARVLASQATAQTIGPVIHHLQILLSETLTRNAQEEIDMYTNQGIEFP